MRKIIVTEFCSLDGLMSDTKDQMEWVTVNFSPDMSKYVEDEYGKSDTLFLGGVTYRIMAAYWPTADTNAAAFEGDAETAATMNNIKKIVFSKTPLKLEWKNSQLLKRIDADEIRKMKQAPGKNMLIAGSATIVQQFTNLGLIDEYHLLVHPIILGAGKPLFKDITEKHNLKLLEAKTFENGVVLLCYQLATK